MSPARLFLEKERIKEKYSEAEDLYEKANQKLKKLMVGVSEERIDFGDINYVLSLYNKVFADEDYNQRER
jgi:hypothetical protein